MIFFHAQSAASEKPGEKQLFHDQAKVPLMHCFFPCFLMKRGRRIEVNQKKGHKFNVL
jgi:hypothetical protein